ncbi:hypothetical protein ACOSP7_022221 [Xanthoceras sorbifolium]|uniref:RING-type E3 ubiquitin transferase n=1 Tax=Xanthoceras sorbifolium TaxID=99658 RepID=A0ABQ8HNX2_9ROSI|nr:hypothetical protein JRO89_XS08G0061900 [Xanthoceras sorbifolium]
MSATQLIIQDFLGKFHSRKLLQHNPLNQQPATAAPPPFPGESNFDSNVVMVLSVLLCALVCSLGLNSFIRCLLRCSSSLVSSGGSSANSSARIANKGIKQKALKTFPVVNYSADLNLPGLDTECVICLSEFAPGERVRLLPKCNHGFHVRCIDKWLKSHSSCPKCRHCLIQTCQKIVGFGSQASSSSGPSPPVQETVVSIAPLEPEGVICNYRGVS